MTSKKKSKEHHWIIIEPGWIVLQGTTYEIIHKEKDNTYWVIWKYGEIGIFQSLHEAKNKVYKHFSHN